jgi:hypothetical protein
MMITTDLDGEIDQGIAEIDTLRGNALQIGGDAEVESGIIEIGETTLMIGLEGAARTLLIRGPVVEEIPTMGSLQAEPKPSKPARSVQDAYLV